MLVLGRKPGEYIVIGDNIMVKVVKSDKGDLRLAIEAPREISIVRGEVYETRNTVEMVKAVKAKKEVKQSENVIRTKIN